MHRMRWFPMLGFAMLLAIATVSPARADIANQGKVFEVWIEDYSPGASELDSDLAYGIRFAYNNSERISYVGEAGYVALSGSFTDDSTTVDVDYSSWFADFIVDINFAAKSKVVPVIFLGLGWASESADATGTGPLLIVEVEDAYESGFTLQGGGALKIQMGKSFELRPGIRLRWFDKRSQDDIDTEYLLGFGYRF